MSDTRKNPIQPGRRQTPSPSHLRRDTPADQGDSAVSAREGRPSTGGDMFAKHTPAMPDDPRWEPRAEGSQVASLQGNPAAPPLPRPPMPSASPRYYASTPSKPASPPQPASPGAAPDRNQGEGDKDAARRYNDAAKEHAESGRSEPAARDATKLSPADLAAEAKGRAPLKVGLLDRAIGLVNSTVNRFDRLLGRSTRG